MVGGHRRARRVQGDRPGDDGAEEAEGSQDGSDLEQHVVGLGVQGGVVRFGLRLGLVERFSWC